MIRRGSIFSSTFRTTLAVLALAMVGLCATALPASAATGDDIALSSSVSPATVAPGGASKFTVTVKNNGTTPVSNVYFTAKTSYGPSAGVFASGLTDPASGDGTTGTRCDLGNDSGGASAVLCQTGALAAGQTRTFTFNITPRPDAGTVVARAALAGPSTPIFGEIQSSPYPGDPNNSNNTTESTVTYAQPDIALSSSVSPATVAPGGASKFTVTVKNNGTTPVSNVYFTAKTSYGPSAGVFASGLTDPASGDGTTGTRCDLGNDSGGASAVLCQTGALAAGQTRTFTFNITPRPDAGTVVARAALAGPSTPIFGEIQSSPYPGDPNNSNNTT